MGAAWWHFHDPALLRTPDGEPIPEVIVAVREAARGHGIGTTLIEAVATEAAKHSSQLSLNVHLRNPAARLYTRTGFRVAGQRRGCLGGAMVRELKPESS